MFIKLWGPCDTKSTWKTTALDPQSLLDAHSATFLSGFNTSRQFLSFFFFFYVIDSIKTKGYVKRTSRKLWV